MRKAVALLLLAAAAGHLLWHRGRRRDEHVVVGYTDGSTMALSPAAPEHETLVGLARKALGA